MPSLPARPRSAASPARPGLACPACGLSRIDLLSAPPAVPPRIQLCPTPPTRSARPAAYACSAANPATDSGLSPQAWLSAPSLPAPRAPLDRPLCSARLSPLSQLGGRPIPAQPAKSQRPTPAQPAVPARHQLGPAQPAQPAWPARPAANPGSARCPVGRGRRTAAVPVRRQLWPAPPVRSAMSVAFLGSARYPRSTHQSC